MYQSTWISANEFSTKMLKFFGIPVLDPIGVVWRDHLTQTVSDDHATATKGVKRYSRGQVRILP
jgi:hypothetical protein